MSVGGGDARAGVTSCAWRTRLNHKTCERHVWQAPRGVDLIQLRFESREKSLDGSTEGLPRRERFGHTNFVTQETKKLRHRPRRLRGAQKSVRVRYRGARTMPMKRSSHGRAKCKCKGCNPCPHDKMKYSCVECKPCPHGRLKINCVKCNPCPHGKRKGNCAECTPCPHGKVKYRCKVCTPCPHGKRKDSCTECNPCPLNKLKKDCAACNRCPHGTTKRYCTAYKKSHARIHTVQSGSSASRRVCPRSKSSPR